MKKIFFINGGAGRVLASIPALEESHRRSELGGIICEGGMEFYMGHPILQHVAWDVNHKGLFENLIKDNQCVSPEPYRDYEYYNQRSSLQQSFWWEIIGERINKNVQPTLILNKSEEMMALEIIGQVVQQHKKEKTIVIQPFGRSSSLSNSSIVYDQSSRSLEQSTFMELVAELSKDYNIMYMGEHKLNVVNLPIFQPDQQMSLRIWAAIIEATDYFIGCDSVGQHIAYSFNKPGTIVCGSTFPINITYPEHFNIIEKKDAVRQYSPIRIAGFASEEADRMNDTIMDFSKEELKSVIENIKAHIKKTTKG